MKGEKTMKEYFEWRGVENGVYAEVISDTSEGITFGEVKEFTGLSEVGKSTESSNEAHYYDNIPAIIVSSTGADTISLNTSGLPLSMVADITGQMYDSTTGMLVEKERDPKYFALGYVTEKTDGTKVLVVGKDTIVDGVAKSVPQLFKLDMQFDRLKIEGHYTF